MSAATSRRSGWPGWTLAVTSVAFFMIALDALVVTTALPVMGRDLRAGLPTLQWAVNTYGLSYAAGIIAAAALGDRYGRRRVFTVGLSVFTLSSAGCALAPTVAWLLAARSVQGLGAAAVMPLSLTILTGAFPPEQRGAVLGIWGGLGGLAVAGGPLIGGAVTEGLGWHWIFWLNVPIGLATIAFSITRLPETRAHPEPLDLPAIALLSSASCALVWGLVRTGTEGWADLGTLAALGGGLLLAVAFILWEGHVDMPMLPPSMFRSQAFRAANATALLMTAALSAAVFLIAQYYQLALGYTPLNTGLRLLPWTATPLLVAPLAGRASDRIGRTPVLASGMLLQAVGLAGFALGTGTSSGSVGLVPALLVAGIGISMALPTVATAVMSAVVPQQRGKASGVNSTLQRLGGVFGVAVVTTMFTAPGQLATRATFIAGFRPALLLAAGLSLLGTLTALAVGTRTAQADQPTSEPRVGVNVPAGVHH